MMQMGNSTRHISLCFFSGDQLNNWEADQMYRLIS
jgi:hypothetical protein